MQMLDLEADVACASIICGFIWENFDLAAAESGLYEVQTDVSCLTVQILQSEIALLKLIVSNSDKELATAEVIFKDTERTAKEIINSEGSSCPLSIELLYCLVIEAEAMVLTASLELYRNNFVSGAHLLRAAFLKFSSLEKALLQFKELNKSLWEKKQESVASDEENKMNTINQLGANIELLTRAIRDTRLERRGVVSESVMAMTNELLSMKKLFRELSGGMWISSDGHLVNVNASNREVAEANSTVNGGKEDVNRPAVGLQSVTSSLPPATRRKKPPVTSDPPADTTKTTASSDLQQEKNHVSNSHATQQASVSNEKGGNFSIFQSVRNYLLNGPGVDGPPVTGSPIRRTKSLRDMSQYSTSSSEIGSVQEASEALLMAAPVSTPPRKSPTPVIPEGTDEAKTKCTTVRIFLDIESRISLIFALFNIMGSLAPSSLSWALGLVGAPCDLWEGIQRLFRVHRHYRVDAGTSSRSALATMICLILPDRIFTVLKDKGCAVPVLTKLQRDLCFIELEALGRYSTSPVLYWLCSLRNSAASSTAEEASSVQGGPGAAPDTAGSTTLKKRMYMLAERVAHCKRSLSLWQKGCQQSNFQSTLNHECGDVLLVTQDYSSDATAQGYAIMQTLTQLSIYNGDWQDGYEMSVKALRCDVNVASMTSKRYAEYVKAAALCVGMKVQQYAEHIDCDIGHLRESGEGIVNTSLFWCANQPSVASPVNERSGSTQEPSSLSTPHAASQVGSAAKSTTSSERDAAAFSTSPMGTVYVVQDYFPVSADFSPTPGASQLSSLSTLSSTPRSVHPSSSTNPPHKALTPPKAVIVSPSKSTLRMSAFPCHTPTAHKDARSVDDGSGERGLPTTTCTPVPIVSAYKPHTPHIPFTPHLVTSTPIDLLMTAQRVRCPLTGEPLATDAVDSLIRSRIDVYLNWCNTVPSSPRVGSAASMDYLWMLPFELIYLAWNTDTDVPQSSQVAHGTMMHMLDVGAKRCAFLHILPAVDSVRNTEPSAAAPSAAPSQPSEKTVSADSDGVLVSEYLDLLADVVTAVLDHKLPEKSLDLFKGITDPNCELNYYYEDDVGGSSNVADQFLQGLNALAKRSSEGGLTGALQQKRGGGQEAGVKKKDIGQQRRCGRAIHLRLHCPRKASSHGGVGLAADQASGKPSLLAQWFRLPASSSTNTNTGQKRRVRNMAENQRLHKLKILMDLYTHIMMQWLLLRGLIFVELKKIREACLMFGMVQMIQHLRDDLNGRLSKGYDNTSGGVSTVQSNVSQGPSHFSYLAASVYITEIVCDYMVSTPKDINAHLRRSYRTLSAYRLSHSNAECTKSLSMEQIAYYEYYCHLLHCISCKVP